MAGAGRAEHGDRRRQPRRPGGVDQRPEFQHMVGMQMGDEDQVERLQADPGIDQAARHAEPAIDDDGPPSDLKEGRARPRPVWPQRRAALRAQQHQPVRHWLAAQDQSPSGVPLKRFFRSAQQSM